MAKQSPSMAAEPNLTSQGRYGPPAVPGSPPGAESVQYNPKAIAWLLRRAAYLSMFSMPNERLPPVPLVVPGQPAVLRGMEVHENVHRFDIEVERESPGSFRAWNTVGQQAGTVHIQWLVVPDDFEAAPDRIPPPTPLDPTRSQRFVMMNGEFLLADRSRSGFHGFGAGRTFPTRTNHGFQLRIGAVVDILEGSGVLRGRTGNVVVNGYITPPTGLALSLMVRIMDPHGELLTDSSLNPIRPIPYPDPEATFLAFLGERDPDNPITLNSGPAGQVLGATVHEKLRLVHIGFDLENGLRSAVMEGPIVGSLSFSIEFSPAAPQSPSPFQTSKTLFNFWDSDGCSIGTLRADIVEGRAFLTPLAGAPPPVFRMVGFGPMLKGSGGFSGCDGMLSVNGAICVLARTPSLLYGLRFHDPDGRLRERFPQVCSREVWPKCPQPKS